MLPGTESRALVFYPSCLRIDGDAAVQMIDTSIVRVHQHGACITKNQRQSMGRSQNGLTSTIHVLVDSNGLPVTGKLLSRLKSGSMLLADRG